MNYSAFPPEERRSLFWHLKRWVKEGFLMDNKALIKFLRDNIGDYTFQEAYDKTGWILNITATGVGEHDENRLLNYLTAPNVLIWSACAASCALPYVFGATEIYCKNADGQI
jgi:predicted acylesterase/phospholipase RssA